MWPAPPSWREKRMHEQPVGQATKPASDLQATGGARSAAARPGPQAGSPLGAPAGPAAGPPSVRSSDPFLLTLPQLAGLASLRILRRGLAYAQSGRVQELAESERRLEGKVKGSEPVPYLVTIEHDGEELLASCSCPFDWEPICKHAVAVLAARNRLVREPRQAQEAASSRVLLPAAAQPRQRGAPAAGADGTVEVTAAAMPEEPIEAELVPPTLVDQEIEVRRRRAEKEGFRVRALEQNGFWGRFEVSSPSGRCYSVEIRSLSERLNRCSCTDYATAMLGTCKHIEAVLAASRRKSPAAFARAIRRPPDVAQLLVVQSDMPRLRLLLPRRIGPELAELARQFFDDQGYFLGDPVSDFAELLTRARQQSRLLVYEDALAWSRQAAEQRQAVRRAEEVRQAVLAAGARIPGIQARLYPYQVEG
ncbi:MAG: hypothetical protein FJ125_13815, partial [Deltaproteobacteria bacterium]|nr:hypothetical protein [Deltaproteobacteria bacterium]